MTPSRTSLVIRIRRHRRGRRRRHDRNNTGCRERAAPGCGGGSAAGSRWCHGDRRRISWGALGSADRRAGFLDSQACGDFRVDVRVTTNRCGPRGPDPDLVATLSRPVSRPGSASTAGWTTYKQPARWAPSPSSGSGSGRNQIAIGSPQLERRQL